MKERESVNPETARRGAYSQGFCDGFKMAEEKFGVCTTCAVCGKRLVVTHQEDKKVLAKFMRDHKWRHPSCAEEKRRR